MSQIVRVDRNAQEMPDGPLTGAAIRQAFAVPTDRDLWWETPGFDDDVLMTDDAIACDPLRFYTVPRAINGG